MNDYILHQSQYIVDNTTEIFTSLDVAHTHFKTLFPENDSTWSYEKYNIFSLTAPSTVFYYIYKELRDLVRSQLGNDRPLWIQAWLNYHRPHEALTRHSHAFDYHGYISLEPKKTNTVFDDYVIENKTGQIYFGPGGRYHSVEVLEPFNGYRTTIGFDVHTTPVSRLITSYVERPFINMSLIPLL